MVVFAIGFSAEAIAIHGTIYFFQSYFVHSNLRLRCGPLRWVLAAPEFHHWLHGNQPEAYNKNYAGQLPVWDWLFGTLHVPGGRMPSRYGVDDPVPHTYPSQFAYSFRCFVRGVRPPARTAEPCGAMVASGDRAARSSRASRRNWARCY